MIGSVSQMIQQERGSSSSASEDDLIRIHHDLMTVYGWIPFEEFKSLPPPTMANLYSLAAREIDKREQFRIIVAKSLGGKNIIEA